MCNIFLLNPGVMPTKSQVETCVYNNWHSMGALIRKDSGLEVIHHIPKSGELDPEMVYDLMLDNRDKQRVIHLRHTTAGATTLENCHPFKVYESKDQTIWFMHNGTLHTYKTMENGKEVLDGPSDTKNFADQILSPMLAAMKNPDINDPLLQKIVNRFWMSSNRGILISSKGDKPFLIDATANPWKTIKGEGEEQFLSANDDYFTTVKRGPELARREEAAKAAKFREENSSREISKYAGHTPTTAKDHGFYKLSQSPCELLNDWEVYERSTAVGVGLFTLTELLEILEKDKDGFAVVAEWIFTDYALMYEELKSIQDKHDKATKLIATLQRELKAKKHIHLAVDNTKDMTDGKEEAQIEATTEVRVG